MDGVFGLLHPAVAAWCEEHLGAPTPPQAAALPLSREGRHTLICSPTGTGKTLAAFLPVMSRLAELRDADELLARTYCLYVSPLRALGYDVEHNLRRPLREMGLLERPNTERARVRRGRVRERFVRTGVRTGDTPVEERRLMMARPPHVLLTTPESLALMVAMDSYRAKLTHVETVIVDEVHALAGNKRGAHLALLLESLAELTRAPLRRVGLSATVAPLESVAAYLAGTERECAVVDCRGLREMRLDIVAPFSGAMATLATCARTAYALTKDARSTLVFTNVRSQAERLAHEMILRQAQDDTGAGRDEIAVAESDPRQTTAARDRRIGVHHSALERSVRHRTEAGLRSGALRTVVCSSSLELGVDIGYVDRVIVLGGARGMTPTLQRVGRAGHRPGAVATGVVIAQDRDDVIEAAATRRCILDGRIEEVTIPAAPLDVLAQWIVSLCVPDRRIALDDALALARRAFPYRALAAADLRACVAYLSGGGAGPDEAHVRRIGTDGVAAYGLGREPSSAYFENVGTIPDESTIPVSGSGGAGIGRLGEAFAASLSEGDVFVLDGRTLRVSEVGPRGLRVEPHAGRPTVPQWSSHLKGVPLLLAHEIGALRRGTADALAAGGTQGALAYLRVRYALDGLEAAHVARAVAQQVALSALPDDAHAVVEIYRMDERQTAVFHTCAGRRVNETLARAVAVRLHRRTQINSTLTTDDGGFLVALPPRRHVADAVWASLLHADGFDDDLLQGLRSSALLRQQFRHVANAGLLVLRRAGGRSIRGGALRWNAAKIFDRLWEADPEFPLIRETIRVVTRDLLDAPAALRYLRGLEGEPRVLHPAAATPFTFGIVTSSFGDGVMLDERAEMVEALHDRVLALLGPCHPELLEGPSSQTAASAPSQLRLL
ncbi:MAG: associated domain protein [Candidatus Eremiobacteraeota bacterium]|nr:associated domain protein [Candidatus Eremiobacteraeota bacterium]